MSKMELAALAASAGLFWLSGVAVGLRLGWKLWRQTYISLTPRAGPIGRF